MKKSRISVFLIIFLATVSQHAIAQVPTVWFVDGGYTGMTETGESWLEPFNTIEEAIMAADENAGIPRDQIWVKAGSYTPLNAATGFMMKENIEVYGGFLGNEAPVADFENNDPRCSRRSRRAGPSAFGALISIARRSGCWEEHLEEIGGDRMRH